MNEISNLINLTKKYLTKYDYENVIKSCEKIMEIDPGSSFGLKFNAIANIKTGNCEEGLKYYTKLYQLYPDNEDIISRLAHLNEKIGNYDEALKLYDKIIMKYPTSNFRKRLLTKIKRYDFLIDECDKKLSSIKEDEICANNKKMGLLEEKAVYLYRKGQYDESYNTFKKVLEIYPESKNGNPYKKDPGWYSHLEECLDMHSNSEEFFNEFFKADNLGIWNRKFRSSYAHGYNFVFADVLIEKNPDNIDILDIIARHSKYFDIDYSLDCYYRILELDHDNKVAVNSIISLYEKNFNKDKALKFIDSKMNNLYLRLSLVRQKIDILESMTLYEEALKSYDDYMKYEHINESDYTQIIFNKLICMELHALELYNDKNYKKAYKILSEVSDKFNNITDNDYYELSDWYNNVLSKSLDKSKDNPEIFFKLFYGPDKKQTESWIKKINNQEYRYSPLKNMGYKIYRDILLGENPTNYMLLLDKARKYYTGIIKPYEAIPIFNQILKINPNNQEILNQKFNMLITSEQYDEAYELLKGIEIDYPVIYYDLNKFVDYLINNHEYEKAKYCLNRLLMKRWTRKELKKLKIIWDKSDDIESQNESSYYMDWISLINFKHEKCICPECHGKLIPIKYGLIIETQDSEFSSNQCYASEKINTLKYRPTDYCPECKKEIYMGLCGIDLKEDNFKLADYTKDIIVWTVEYLEEYPVSSIDSMQKYAYKEFAINNREFKAYIDKLVEIEFLVKEKNQLKLCDDYSNFKNTIKQKYNGKSHIFSNKNEFKKYIETCKEFKNYENFEEYIEDIKLCLTTCERYSYEKATDLLKGERDDLQGGFIGKSNALDVADEIYWDYNFVGF